MTTDSKCGSPEHSHKAIYFSKFFKKAKLSKKSSVVDDDDGLEALDRSASTYIAQTFEVQYELKTYPQAWIALLLLVLLRTAVSVFQFTFSIIPSMTADYYNVTLTAVNWFANIQCIIYVLMSFFTGFIFEKLGVKKSIIVSGFLLALGSTIRCIASKVNPPSYSLAMVGQTIGGAAAPMALNIMTMFSATWFTENLRATAGMFVASNYGAILVMFVIPSITKGASDIPFVLNLVAGLCFIVLVPLLFMPASPPTPPTRVQEEQRPPFFEGLKILSRNSGFWIIFFIHSLNVGLSIAFSTLFAQIIAPHGYSNTDAGQLNAVAFFVGTLGCSVAGPVIDLTKQYKLFLKLISPMILVTDIGFIFLVREKSYPSILFITALNQFFLSFLVPVVIETGSETSYPVAEATTNSLLWQGAQLFGFLFVLTMDVLRTENGTPKNNMTNAIIFQAAVAGLITILCFVFNGKMARSDANQLEHEETKLLSDEKQTNNNTFLDTTVIGVDLQEVSSLQDSLSDRNSIH